MLRRHSPAVFKTPELESLLKSLGPDHKFVKWIEDMKIVLEGNKFAGDLIEKKKIPKYYVRCYGVNNLYHYRHPEGYRSCYTISNREGVGVCPLILDILSHSEYERIFGYRKR